MSRKEKSMKQKNMKPLLLLAMLFVGNVALAGTVTTVKVTTTADENGSNSGACSLREALHVINDKAKAPWGGCPAGGSVGDNVIQLEAATYSLALGELVVLADVTIAGADTTVSDDESTTAVDESLNPYTGVAPYRRPPLTIIDANSNSRIINTLGATGSSLSLRDIELRNGRAAYASSQGNGGAIYAALSLTLDNVLITGSYALGFQDNSVTPAVFRGGMGGAIFLSKSSVSLSLSNTSLVANSAEGTGGALAMVCDEDLAPAVHTIAITSSLLAGNISQRGAGVLEACGSTSVELSVSTLSANQSPALGQFGAVTYLQAVSGLGALVVTNVTAAEQNVGPVFSLKGVNSVSLNNSLLIGNDGGNCLLDSDISFPSGNYNSIDNASCDALLLSVLNSSSANLHPPANQLANELLTPLALKGGLTKVYLLNANSAYALNKGLTGDSCSGTDQRGLSRKNGATCDIGAVERLQPTAVDDEAENGTDSRVIIVDVLANDSFGESDSGPSRFADPDLDGGQEAVEVVNGGDLLSAGPPPKYVCTWGKKNDSVEAHRNKLIIDNLGAITPEITPITCTYKIHVVSAGVPDSSTVATVTAAVKNISPKAINNIYVRPVGVSSISINPLSNDTDADDASPFDSLLNPYPIYISSQPTLGHIEGVSGHCPDYNPSSGVEKICYAVPLKYVADNPQSPFADSFQYSVFDDDGKSSTAATVTIKTDAPDIDKGETGGSLDFAGGLLLALLGLRRARKL